jgi:hypothetical protein
MGVETYPLKTSSDVGSDRGSGDTIRNFGWVCAAVAKPTKQVGVLDIRQPDPAVFTGYPPFPPPKTQARTALPGRGMLIA